MAPIRSVAIIALPGVQPFELGVAWEGFGIDRTEVHTLEEVGRSLDLTRERIRQIESKALKKLLLPSQFRRLKSYLTG